MYKIAIDLGYGYTKGIGENEKTVLFPSVVGPGKSRDLANALGSLDTGMDKLHVEIDGKEYYIGELAMEEAGGLSTGTMEGDKTSHEHTKALLAVATALVLPQGYRTYHLSTGLPLNDYITQRESFEKMLRSYDTNIRFISGPLKGRRLNIRFTDVTIFPQAAGVIYTGRLLQELQTTEQLTAIIDIGYRTTDFIVFSIKNGLLDLRPDLSRTLDVGMSQVLASLQAEFAKRTGKRLSHGKVFMLLERKTVTFRGEKLDFSDFIEQAKREVANYTLEAIKNIWQEEIDFIDQVFLAGGSSVAMEPYLKRIHPKTILIEDAQMANAKGFLNFAKLSEKAKENMERRIG